MIAPLWLVAAWGWLKKNWMWILLPVGVLLFLSGRLSKKTQVIEVVNPELQGHEEKKRGIDQKADAELKRLQEERAKKLAAVEAEHSAVLEALREEQKKKADDLRDDPDQLARYLLEVGKDIRGER